MVIILAGCAPARESSLSEVVPFRTYATTMDEMATALRVFCQREDFSVHIAQSSFGQLLAHRIDVTLRDEDRRTIILHVDYTPKDSLVLVKANFGFANIDATPTRSDEHMLIDYYHRLFDFLQDNF